MSGGLFTSEGICEQRVSTSIKTVPISVQPWASNLPAWTAISYRCIWPIWWEVKDIVRLTLAAEASLMRKTLVTYNKKRFIWTKIEQEDEATYIDCMFVRRLLIIEDVRKMPTEMVEWDASISLKFSPNQWGKLQLQKSMLASCVGCLVHMYVWEVRVFPSVHTDEQDHVLFAPYKAKYNAYSLMSW